MSWIWIAYDIAILWGIENDTGPPLPCANENRLVQGTLECHWLTQWALGYHWVTFFITCGIHWNTTGKVVKTGPDWNANREILFTVAYTGTPLEKKLAIDLNRNAAREILIIAAYTWILHGDFNYTRAHWSDIEKLLKNNLHWKDTGRT